MINKINMKDIAGETVLWRYMDLSKFVSLLSTKSLWLARADTFKDKSEGKFHLEMKKILDEAYANLPENDNDIIKNRDDFQNYLIKNAFICSWHSDEHESMVMWEIYSQTQEAVAIKTTVDNLLNSIDISKHKRQFIEFIISKVDYTPGHQIQGKLKYHSPFFIKRPHFKHEKEVRLFLSSYSSVQPTLETPFGHNVPMNISQGIQEIIVHPDAHDWFLNSVKDLLRVFKFDIPVKKGGCGNSE